MMRRRKREIQRSAATTADDSSEEEGMELSTSGSFKADDTSPEQDMERYEGAVESKCEKGVKQSETTLVESDASEIGPCSNESGSSSSCRRQEDCDIQSRKRGRKKRSSYATASLCSNEQCKNNPCFRAENQGSYSRTHHNEKKTDSSTSSETDESSPECERLSKVMSKSQCKRLNKVFKRFFGKLCYAITKPVEIATELQKKALISHSRMANLLRSPESQKDKAINLICALERKVKLHPGRIHVIIGVLLHNDELQEVGREMLSEAEKVCPNRSVTRFSDHQLPSEDARFLGKHYPNHNCSDQITQHAVYHVSHPNH
jgi:hypothetical protein